MSIKSVPSSQPANPSNSGKSISDKFYRALTRPCYNFCVKELPKSCQDKFGPEGFKKTDKKCIEVWRKCMERCIQIQFLDL
jgi:hypothetical protein